MNNKTNENYSSPVINDLLKNISEEEFELTEKKMELAVRIADALEAKGMQKQNLAKILNKQPSEISKWLSGTHNFTIETLFLIEKVLGIYLINWTEKQEVKTIFQKNIVIVVQQPQPAFVYRTPINELTSLFGNKNPSPSFWNYCTPLLSSK